MGRYRLNALILLTLIFGLIELIDWRNNLAMLITAFTLVALLVWAQAWDKRIDRRERDARVKDAGYHKVTDW